MAVQAQLADGRILEFPDGTDPSVVQATVKRMLSSSVGMDVSQMSTEELENAPSAPTTLGDIGRSLGAGVVGGAKTVADVFGAGNDVSNYLGKKAQEIQANITPERKAEMARRQELEKRASESGDLWQEAKAYLGGIAEAPIQSVAQAVGTSAPTLVAGLASVFAAPESALGIGVARMGQIALGAAQGVGEYKGDVHDSVKQAYMDEGYDASEAEKLAVRAQQYSMDKAMEIGGAGLLGALDAFTGVESSVRKAVEKAGKGKLTKEAIEAGIKELPEEAVTAPSLGMAALKSAAGEAPLEGLQGGFGQYAQNLALQREGLQEGDETQGVLGAALRDAAVGALTGGAFTPVKLSEMRSDYNLDQTLRQAKQDQEFEQERQAAIERSAGLPPQPEVYELPEGYRVTAQDVGVTEEPAEHHIMEEGSDVPLTTVPTLEEVQPKIDRLTEIRKAEAQKTLDQIDKINEGIKKQTEQLETLEATGQANTPQYEALKQQTQMAQDTASQQVAELMDKNETLTKNLVHVPGAPQQKVQQQFVLSKDGQNLGAFNSLQEAEHTVKRFVSPEAFKEFEETKEPVKPTIEPDQIETLKSTLEPLMAKFGLKDVGLNIVDNLKHGAEGSYTNKLVSVALDNPNPIQVLRHESIHALKDLGFFTPQQWSVLENMAKKKWIAEHLEGNRTEIDGENMTRLEGYKKMGLNDQQIAEEAIADAFAHFDKTKPPPGMLAALHNKLIKFFEALKNGFTGAGFQTAEHVFGKIERGELKGAENERPTGAVAGPGPTGGERKFSLGEGDRGTRAEARSIAPLEGAPTVQGAAGPDANLVSVAEKYAKDNGIKLNRQAKYAQVNEVFGKRLAQAYEEMPHAPNDPKVKEAYEDLIHQTRKQYDALVDAGYKFNFFDSETDPYQGNPWNAMRDLRKNKTMSVYGTYDGFGTEGVTDADVKDNPLLQNTGLKWKDQKGVEHDVTGNDLFRAVHDAFGHGIEGGGFRHHGEENAWQAHSRLYTGPALAALTSETRGQNSWLNFGPYGEKNKNAKVEETVFAPQKTGLMPEWAWKENTVLSEPDFIREPNIKGVTLGKKQPNASTFIGVHHGNAKVDVLSGKKYGTGIRGAERRRLDDAFDNRIKNRVYFYIPKENGEMPSPEAGLGGHVYKQKFDNILAPGSEMSKLFSKAQGDSNNFESEVIDAGYDGYAVPSMGMMVILNHDAPVHHLGTRAELAEQGIKYSLKKSDEEGARGVAPSTGTEKLSLKRVSFPTAREARAAAKEAGIPDDAGFHKFIRATQFVDKDGKPKVMYHGTAGDIFEFIPAGQSNAIFVTDSAEEAEGFASEAEDRLRRKIYQALDKNEKVELFKRVADQAAADGEITQALANGIVSRVKKKVPEYGDFFGDIEQRMYDELIGLSPARASVMPVWVSGVNIFDYENPYHVEGVMERLKDNVKFEQRAKESEFTEDSPRAYPDHWLAGTKGRIVRGVWQAIEDKRVQQAIRDSGFDGFSVKEINGGRKNFAVYKPNQIKSVTGNVGEYSTNNKDIRYSLRAAPDTPEFKQWFKQSAVIDEDGKPMVMYHGTKADISKFKLDKKAHRSGNPDGYYFTPSTTDASRYAGENGNVMPVYLSIQNPFVQGSKVDYRMIGQYEKELRKDNPNLENDWIESKVNSFKQLAARGNNWFPGIFPNISFPTEAMTRVLEAGGYDGFKDGNHFIAIRPEQIKSATGNAGTYDVNNPDIRYSIPSISTAAEDRVNKVTTVREEQGFLSRMFSVLQPENYSSYRQAFLNRYNQLSEADKAAAQRMGGINLMAQDSAEHAALMSDMHAGVTASAFGVGGRKGGVPVIRNGLTTIDNSKKGLLEILMPLGKYNDPKVYQYFQFYSAVKRGVRLYSEGRERLIEPGDLVFAKELGQKFPEFEQIRKDWVEYNNNLIAYQKAAGVLSDRDAIEYTKHYDYIPFFRQLDGEKTMGPSIYQSISGVKKPKALKGGEAPLADFLETVVRNSQSAIAAGMKNIAAQRARDVGKQANIVHDITPGSKVSDFEKIKVLENGILKEYQSSDRLFIDAVKSLHMPEIPFMGLLSSPSNFLREAVTRDPGFILANLMRDSLSAYATSGQNMTPVIDTVKNFGKAFARKSPGFEAMMNYGIIGGYEFSENVEQSGRTVAKEISKRAGNKAPIGLRTFKSLWDGLEHATTASDAATRIAIYDRVMQETGNEAEAIRAAWEIMNFNRKGNSPLVRVLTAAVPFLNARVQGLDLFYRSATGKMNTQDAKLIQKRFIARASMMMALSVMYTLAVSGDPDYENQEDETKDNYWILPSLGLKIPIPFEVGTLFKTIPERIVRATFGNDTGQDLKDALWRATLTTLPINPVGYVPQVFKPMVEVMTNYNMFTGREIIGQGMKDIAPEYQVGPGTSNFSVFVGKTLGLSPMKVDHLIKGYSGTMGMYAIDLMDSIMDMNSDSPKPNKRFEQMPVIKRFALDPEARGSVTAYYKLKNDVDTAVRTSNLLEKSMEPDEFAKYMQENMGVLAFKDYVGDLEKSMKQFRDMRKMVTSSPMPGKEKQEALTAIGKGEQNLTANIQTVKKIIADI